MKAKLLFATILIFCMVISGRSQVGLQYELSSKPNISQDTLPTQKVKVLPSIYELKNESIQALTIPSYRSKHYGIFCKVESMIEKTSKVPLRFRLGSLDYVNNLEQKYVAEPLSNNSKRRTKSR